MNIQKSCDKTPEWPLRSLEAQRELEAAIRDPQRALLTPTIAAFCDTIAGVATPNSLRHNYIWARHGDFLLSHPLDIAIVFDTYVEVHPDATLFTEFIVLMHPECQSPPPPSKYDVELVNGYYRPRESPPLTRRQLEPTCFRGDYHKIGAGTITQKWLVIERHSGSPDAGIMLRLNSFTGLAFIRTSRSLDEFLRQAPHIRHNLYGSAAAGLALALDHCPFLLPGAETAKESPFGVHGRSLSDSQDIMSLEQTMPLDGLFTARHIDGVSFTSEGRVRWGTSAYGHYFVSEGEDKVYVFFSLDNIYRLAKTRGKLGKRAMGLPEPWRIWEHPLPPLEKARMLAASDSITAEDAVLAVHSVLGTRRGPFTHFTWEAA